MSCSSGTLNVSAATYFANGSAESCLPYVSSTCAGQASCNVTFSNTNCGGDPNFGFVKSATASITCSRPIALIQNAYATPQSPQSVVTVTLPSAEAAGNTTLLAIGWNDSTSSITSVQDSLGNAYQTAVPTFQGNGLSQAIYYATQVNAGTNTVTVQFNQAVAYADVRAAEYSGVSMSPGGTVDTSASASGLGSVANAGSITVSGSNELVFAAGMTDDIFGEPGGGFTTQVITSPDSDIAEYEIATSPGAVDALGYLVSGNWLMQSVAFHGQ